LNVGFGPPSGEMHLVQRKQLGKPNLISEKETKSFDARKKLDVANAQNQMGRVKRGKEGIAAEETTQRKKKPQVQEKTIFCRRKAATSEKSKQGKPQKKTSRENSKGSSRNGTLTHIFKKNREGT